MYDRLEVARFIDNFIIDNYTPPTIREIMSGMDIPSSATVHKILRDLEEMEYVRILGEKGSTRSCVPMWVINLIKEKGDEKCSKQ